MEEALLVPLNSPEIEDGAPARASDVLDDDDKDANVVCEDEGHSAAIKMDKATIAQKTENDEMHTNNREQEADEAVMREFNPSLEEEVLCPETLGEAEISDENELESVWFWCKGSAKGVVRRMEAGTDSEKLEGNVMYGDKVCIDKWLEVDGKMRAHICAPPHYIGWVSKRFLSCTDRSCGNCANCGSLDTAPFIDASMIGKPPVDRIKTGADVIKLLGELFDNYDKDGSGEIDQLEFSSLLKDYYLTEKVARSKAKIDKETITVLSKFDFDGDGTLDFAEYIRIFTSGHFKFKIPPEVMEEVKLLAPSLILERPIQAIFERDDCNLDREKIKEKSKEVKDFMLRVMKGDIGMRLEYWKNKVISH